MSLTSHHGNSDRQHVPPIRKLFPLSLKNDEEKSTDTFRVFLRIKPNSVIDSENDCIAISDDTKLVCKPPVTSKFKKLEKVQYTFSHIFGPETTQKVIFSECIANCVEDLLYGGNGLIFAYGTTNAGKTFTVQGTSENPGIIPQTLYALFSGAQIDELITFKPCMAKDVLRLKSTTSSEEHQAKLDILHAFSSGAKVGKLVSSDHDASHFIQALEKSSVELKCRIQPQCSIWISFVEVYNETIYDLLDSTVSRKPLRLAADNYDNFYVKGLKYIHVTRAEEAFTIYQFGKRNLNMASTRLNETSSRSHCIFNIHVINTSDNERPVLSRLSICDLAGTERLTKTQNTGIRLKETGNINGSLFQLNRCLRAIRDNQTKRTNQLIPYRYSNLTKLLHTALDDRTMEKIIMIVNINPSAELYDETQQVLKMCAIASRIKNKPITNSVQRTNRFTTLLRARDEEQRAELSDFDEDIEEDPGEVQELRERLARLEKELLHSRSRETYLKTMKIHLEDYCTKVQKTYQKRVHDLEERIKSQKAYYVWKIKDVRKNMASDHTIDEEFTEKVAEVESSDKALEHERLLHLEEIQAKDKKIQELNSLVQEAKDEYLLLEKNYKTDHTKLLKLENQLRDKNEIIENFENTLNMKQNLLDEAEDKIDLLELYCSESAVESERMLDEIERDREMKLTAKQNMIDKLKLKVDIFKRKLAESTRKLELSAEKENPGPYNLRRKKRPPLAKIDQVLDLDTSLESTPCGKKDRLKKKAPRPRAAKKYAVETKENQSNDLNKDVSF